MKKRSRNLTEGDIKKQLFQLTWPMLFGMLGIVIFNLVDTYFIGKLGVKELAGISFCFPVIMFLNSLSQGVGIGTSSIISRNIIVADKKNIRLIASRSLLLGVLIVILFVGIGLSTIRPLFTALGAGNDIMPFIYDYMSIWFWGVPFVVMPMIGNNIIRATGDTFSPGMLMISSGIINTILDPILIFGLGIIPAMGIKGAATATVIARSTSMIFILFLLIKREKLLTNKLGKLQEIFSTWKQVLYIAAPASLGILLTPVSVGIITKLISQFGAEAVAAFGVTSRIEMFILSIIAALGSVLIIFIGQNLSKQKFDRIFKALRYSTIFSLFWGAVVYAILFLWGTEIASLFTKSQGVIDISYHYFIIMGISYGFQGMIMLSSSSYNGINRPLPATAFAILRMAILYVPIAWIASEYFGLTGIFVAGIIANIISGVWAYIHLNSQISKLQKNI
jgi:putative MATE family efflux protein